MVTTEDVVSYTFHISRDSLLIDDSFENLVILTDSINTVRAYIIKYNLLSEPVYLNEHDSYIVDTEKEVTPIIFNSTQARISVIGNDGCTVLTLMCPYEHPHPAGGGCIAEDRGDLYWVADSSGCGGGGGGSSNGNTGTSPGNGNSSGNQNGGGSGNGGTRSVSPIVTTPVGLDGITINDPCINAAQGNQKSKNIFNEPNFQLKLNQINTTLATDTVEKGFAFGIKTDDNSFTTSEIITGTTTTSVVLPVTAANYNVTGNVHTHPVDGFDSFSPMDFYGFHTSHTANSNFSTMFVLGANGEVYSLTITDPVKFTNFAGLFPVADHFDPVTQGWKVGSPIEKAFMDALRNFRDKGKSWDEAYALANAYVLRKYNAGMSISKKDSNGDFKTLFVEEKKDPNDDTKTIYEQTSTCNLKKKI
ncbi:MAG: hypothetical protein RBR78_10765 [Flavobacteriaceae bacterium]|nr:hypothetical protein [Flavobacteriaceae bacterium]